MMKKRRTPALLSILGEDGQEDSEKGPDVGELEQCAHELIEAVHARNVGDAVAALKAFFACCDAEPHVEGPHEGE